MKEALHPFWKGLAVVLCLAISTQAGIADAFIPSTWEMDDSEASQEPVSATELETRDERIREAAARQEELERERQRQELQLAKRRRRLIDCLNQRQAVVFMVPPEDCHPCKVQKSVFGEEFADLKVVNCEESKFRCTIRGIDAYPTWHMGRRTGIKKEGALGLAEIARLAECSW